MDMQKVYLFMAQKAEFFPAEKIPLIKEKLLALDDDKFLIVSSMDLKNPTHMLIFSILLGGAGVDRFLLGDIGMGILKFLTSGLCGILWIIDIINIKKMTKEKNFNDFMTFISM